MNKKIISLHSEDFYKNKSLELEKQADFYIKNKDYKKVVELFLEASKFDPYNEDYIYYAGVYSYLNKDIQNAKKYIWQVLKKDENNKDYNMAYGELLFENKEITESKKYFEKVNRLIGFDLQANIYIGKCLYKENKFEESLDLLKSLMIMHPDDPEILFEIAVCYMHSMKFLKAREYFYKSLEVKKNEFITYQFLMKNLLKIGEHDEAIELLEQMKIYCPDKAEIADKNIMTIKMIKKI